MKILFELIKFEHTIFALPFAYLGVCLARNGIVEFYYWFWITMAMVGARTAGMALNRLIDRKIDAQNPRTSNRPIQRGVISHKQVKWLIIGSFALLFFSCLKLNEVCLLLSPLVVCILVVYPYLKRITWLSHFVLGLILGCAPVGGGIAIIGHLTIAPLILAISVFTWTAGFDIIYATMDIEFDRGNGLYSIPQRFGLKPALISSSILHICTVVTLVYLGWYIDSGPYYWIGITITALLLYYEHTIISPADISKVNMAFFNINGAIGIILFFFTLLDLL